MADQTNTTPPRTVDQLFGQPVAPSTPLAFPAAPAQPAALPTPEPYVLEGVTYQPQITPIAPRTEPSFLQETLGRDYEGDLHFYGPAQRAAQYTTAGSKRSGSKDDDDTLPSLADLAAQTAGSGAATADEDTTFLGRQFRKFGGGALGSLGGLLELTGRGISAVNDWAGFVAEDEDVASGPGGDLISNFLIENGRSMMDWGDGISQSGDTEQSREVLDAMGQAWEEGDNWVDSAFGATSQLFQEGGLEALSGMVSGSIGYIVGSGGVVGGARATGGKVLARFGLRQADDVARAAATRGVEAAGLEAYAAGHTGNMMTRAAARMGRTATDSSMIAISAAAGGQASYDADKAITEQLTGMGDARYQLPVWQRTRDMLTEMRGEPVSDEVVDAYVTRGYASRAGFSTAAMTHAMTVLSPISEGAFTRWTQRRVVVPGRTGVTGFMAGAAGRVGRVTGATLREGAAESVEERMQTAAGTADAAQAYLSNDDVFDALAAGWDSSEAIRAGGLGAITGGFMGGAIGGLGRRVDEAQAREDAKRITERAMGDTTDAEAEAAARASEQEAYRQLERDAADRERAARQTAIEQHNELSAIAVSAVSGVPTEQLGKDQTFGVGSSHGDYNPVSVSDQAQVVFSSSEGALAHDPVSGAVMYAAPSEPTAWMPLSEAPAHIERAAPAALYAGSFEGDAELNYAPGMEAAIAMGRAANTALSTEADSTFAAVKETVDGMLSAELETLRAEQAEAAMTQQDRMAELRTTKEAEVWNETFRKAANNGVFIPPVPAAFDPALNGPMGINDYAAYMRERIGRAQASVDARLSGDRRAGTNFVRGLFGGSKMTPVLTALVNHRNDPAMLRAIVAGDTRMIGGKRVDGDTKLAAQEFLAQHELRDMYAAMLIDSQTFGPAQNGTPRAAAVMAEQLGRVDAARQDAARQTFEAMVQERVNSEVYGNDGAPGQTLGDIMSETEATARAQADQIAALEAQRADVAGAKDIVDLARVMDLKPGSALTTVLEGDTVTSSNINTMTDVALGRHIVKQMAPAVSSGPDSVYETSNPQADIIGPLPADQQAHRSYDTAVRELGKLQLAARIQNGQMSSKDVVRAILTRFPNNPDAAATAYIETVQASKADPDALAASLSEAQQRVNDVLRGAMKTAQEQAEATQAADAKPETKTKPKKKKKTKKKSVAGQRAAHAAAHSDPTAPKPAGLSKAEVEAFAETKRRAFSHLSDQLRIVVHGTNAEAKTEVDTHYAAFKAMFVPAQGPGQRATVHLVADQFSDAKEMERVFDHEVIGHFSLRKLLGAALPMVRDAVAKLATDQGRDGKVVRSYWNRVREEQRAVLRQHFAKKKARVSDKQVENMLDAKSAEITEEVMALIIEDAADTTLVNSSAPKLFGFLGRALQDAGFNPKTSEDIGAVLAMSREYARDDATALRKNIAADYDTASADRQKALKDKAPFVSDAGWWKRFYTKAFSDAVGIREFETVMVGLAPGAAKLAARARSLVEAATSDVDRFHADMRSVFVDPIRKAMTRVMKEAGMSERAAYIELNTWMLAKHAVERNESSFYLNARNGLPEHIIQQRDAIIEEVMDYATDENGLYGDALARIKLLFDQDPDAQKLVNNTINDPDYVGMSGYSARQANEALASVDPRFLKAAERADIRGLTQRAQDAILQSRRQYGPYGENGYKRLKMHGWTDYVPLRKEEISVSYGENGEVDVLAPDYADAPAEKGSIPPTIDWIVADPTDTAVWAKRDKGRVLSLDNNKQPSVTNVLHTLQSDAFYTAHERVTAQIGRAMIAVVDMAKQESPAHAKSMDDTYMQVTDTIAYEDKVPDNAPSKGAPNVWTVFDENGDYRIVKFKSNLLAKSVGSRFNTTTQLAQQSGAAKVVAPGTRLMAKMFTSYNLPFLLIRQGWRDITQNVTAAITEHKIDPVAAMSIVARTQAYNLRLTKFYHMSQEKRAATLEKALKDKRHPLHNFAMRHDLSGVDHFDKQFLANGDSLAARRVSMGPQSALGKARSVFDKADNFLGNQASAMDNAARQAYYDVLVENGKKPEEAAQITRDMMNFANRSDWGRSMSPWFAFAQTALSSFDAMASKRLWKGGKAPMVSVPDGNGGFRTRLDPNWLKPGGDTGLNYAGLAGRAAVGFMATSLAAMQLEENDDPTERSLFDQLDPFTLMTNIVIPTGGEDGILKLPMQIGFDSMMHALGVWAYLQMADERGERLESSTAALAKVVTSSLTPFNMEYGADVDAAAVLNMLVPTVFAPLAGATFGGGYDKFASNLDNDVDLPVSPYTSPALTSAMRWVNDTTGIDLMSSDSAHALAQGYLGGMFNTLRSLERLSLVSEEGGPMGERSGADVFWNYTGIYARDPQFDAGQSVQYYSDMYEQLSDMRTMARNMDGFTGTYRYDRIKDDPAKIAALPPNLREFHVQYGELAYETNRVIQWRRSQFAMIKRQIDDLRTNPDNAEYRNLVGQLLQQRRVIDETASAQLRAMFADPATQLPRELDEPSFIRLPLSMTGRGEDLAGRLSGG